MAQKVPQIANGALKKVIKIARAYADFQWTHMRAPALVSIFQNAAEVPIESAASTTEFTVICEC
jgi:hypothetical protein